MNRLDEDVRERLRASVVRPRRRADLLALGLTDPDLRRLVRGRRLVHHHGHYVDAGCGADLVTARSTLGGSAAGTDSGSGPARMACALAAFPGSALSHFSAACSSDLRTWVDQARAGPDEEATWLTRPPGVGRNTGGPDVVLRLAGLDDLDLRAVAGMRITSDARTVVDLARELPLRGAVVTVDHALRVAVTRPELEEVLARQEGWPGVRRARSAVAFGDPRSESALESIARAAIAEAGLPPPVLQAQFWDGASWTPERTDFWWPQFHTSAEADGLAKFEAASPAERRRLHRAAFHREQRLAAVTGAEMVRFGWEDAVNDPGELAVRLIQAFHRGLDRRAEPLGWRSADPDDAIQWPLLPQLEEPAPLTGAS